MIRAWRRAVSSLAGRVKQGVERIEVDQEGKRVFQFEAMAGVDLETYASNCAATADWVRESMEEGAMVYVGFEAFYDRRFEAVAALAAKYESPLAFSTLVKKTREYLRARERFEAMETKDCWNRSVIHLGASHVVDKLLFKEDKEGHLQRAWANGKLTLVSPELVVSSEENLVYRAGLSRVIEHLGAGGEEMVALDRPPPRVDYKALDVEIADAKRRVEASTSIEEAFAEVFRTVAFYVERNSLDSPCWWDSGFETWLLYENVAKILAEDGAAVPWTRAGLVVARNSAIGDSIHAFYSSPANTFPIVVTGDTACLLAGGASMVDIHASKRFGAVVVLNNKGMAIEDAISHRTLEGHQFSYEFSKRNIRSLAELKGALTHDFLDSLRDYCWGVSSKKAKAVVLNVDLRAIRGDTDQRRRNLDEDFSARFAALEAPRTDLEKLVEAMYDVNGSSEPVKIQGCSAIEFMEIFSQLTMIARDKLIFIAEPTDLLGTRTLVPALAKSRRASPDARANNTNSSFAVFVSNAAFGMDGLSNLVSTHLEYGTIKLVHLIYDAADRVSHYASIGQVHRNFGVKLPNIIPAIYLQHQAYEGQILFLDATDRTAPDALRAALLADEVKCILVDMGAPNLTNFLADSM